LAISGAGFFILNSEIGGGGNTFYGRDGTFDVGVGDLVSGTTTKTSATPSAITGPNGGTLQIQEGYLADKNGYFVQGRGPETDGTFSSTSALQSLRVDQFAFTNNFKQSTAAKLVLNLPAQNLVGDPASTYSVSLVDSGGNQQGATLSFTKADATNPLLWNMTTTTSQATVAQVDTVTLSGTVTAGDVYAVTVDSNTASYTVTATDVTFDDVRDGLIAAIAGSTNVSAVVTAAAGGTGALTLTSKNSGTAFTATTSLNGTTAAAQNETLTLAGTFDVGDVYTATVNGTVYTYTAAATDTSLTDVATNLASVIGLGETDITASSSGAVVTLTAKVPGTPFTVAALTATDSGLPGSTADETNTGAVVTANVTIPTALATTTANVINSTTSAAVALTFLSDGTLSTPTSVALALTFAEGTTGSIALDISGITAFAGDFTPLSFSGDGFASAALVKFTYDALGQVIGSFDDGSNRAIYKIPIATFSNPNGLNVESGNVFTASNISGPAAIGEAGSNGFATFLPGTRELSNVNIADEFTRMIRTQSVYNAAATNFRTVDEMIQTARDLKR
jgi:flagellar hook-basal body protein